MIVGASFEGDWDDVLKWKQHDVYGDALGIIVATCREHVARAASLLEVERPRQWETDAQVDHRVLQDAHDILAAVWRHATSPRQTSLLLEVPATRAIRGVNGWLEWLRVEVRSWSEEPRLVALVSAILANQNQPTGYQAEEELVEFLHRRFSAEPWCHWPRSGGSGNADLG